MKRLILLAGVATFAVAFLPRGASATMDIQKQAKAAGVKDVTCATCHVAKLPKKGASEPSDRVVASG